ncbi:MAG TPA: carbonic anhydrase [Edaphobacter sp.]|jgi:carbonic anhydrase|nr:carbonic anhydrase [Edaphobacter sp.]
MQRLIDGYLRFRSKVFPLHSKLFEKLARGQKPQALFIACSDSRVMPEMVMQCDPGDLFPCRNAGNLVPPSTETSSGVAATIEYAVRVLKVPDVVICGHSDCGAMKGILQQDHLDELPMVKSWLHHAGPSSRWLRDTLQDASSWSFEKKLELLTEANVIMQMQNLSLHPAVAEGLKSGTVQVHGWMYDIGSGGLRRFDSERGSFRALVADGAPTTTQAQPERKIA